MCLCVCKYYTRGGGWYLAIVLELSSCTNRVKHGEDSDADHELLKLVGLGAVVLHDCPDAEQRDEAGQQEDRAERQVDEQRRQHETAQHLHVPQPHVADSRQDVTCNHKLG